MSCFLRLNRASVAAMRDILGPASRPTLVTSHPLIGDVHIPSQGLVKWVLQYHHQATSQFTQKRTVTTSRGKKSATHYYDVLGLTPEATQVQIKSAYYEMSKLYHPDVSDTPKDNELFREVSEAYEVLGNLKTRRMYDKGFKMQSPHSRGGPTQDEPDVGDYREYWSSRNFERGNRPPPPRGRTNIYNFDEFYRQHYNDVRERRKTEEAAYRKHMDSMDQSTSRDGYGSVLVPIWICLLFAAVLSTADHDKDKRHLIDRRQSRFAGGDNVGKS